MIDQIRASKLPSNMMQFAARGALSVPPDENIEILVHLAKHNKVFGDLARMTLAGWDEKASLAAASDPKTPREVLDYMIAPENLRPKLLPALLENPSVNESELAKFALSVSHDGIEAMLKSSRIRSSLGILESLRANPYLKPNEADEVRKLLNPSQPAAALVSTVINDEPHVPESVAAPPQPASAGAESSEPSAVINTEDAADEEVAAYFTEHASEIAAEPEKPFQAIGILELGIDSSPVSDAESSHVPESKPSMHVAESSAVTSSAAAAKATIHQATGKKPQAHTQPRRENTLQKINRLDIKGRIQLALKGNKEERSLLIRDGTKVVALAVLDAPKISDGEVEKIASQKNVLEAVLRTIPLKRRFMKNYIVVRNLVFNPRTPLDLSLGLMKNLLMQDLKNLSSNKEVSDTIRKLALKMVKQKLLAEQKK
jgi:hypothetical protein